MGMFPGGQASCLQLSRRFTKDERGKRKKKPREAVDRGRKRRGRGSKDVKNVSRANEGKKGRKREDFLADFSGAFVFNLLPLIQTTRLACTYFLEFSLYNWCKKTLVLYEKRMSF